MLLFIIYRVISHRWLGIISTCQSVYIPWHNCIVSETCQIIENEHCREKGWRWRDMVKFTEDSSLILCYESDVRLIRDRESRQKSGEDFRVGVELSRNHTELATTWYIIYIDYMYRVRRKYSKREVMGCL